MYLFVALVCFGILGNTAWQMWKAHEMAIRAGEIAASNLAHAMAQHSADTLKAADLTISTLADRVEQLDGTTDSVEKIRLSLLKQKESLPQIQLLSVVNVDGAVIVSTAADFTQISELERDNFNHHRDLQDTTWYVGKSAQIAKDGSWVLVMSRRINHADGNFGGIALAHIDVDFLLKYFSSINLGKKGSIAMLTDDGILILRRPILVSAIGKKYSKNPIFTKRVAGARSGTFAITSTLDHVERIVGYSWLEKFPLVAIAALSNDEVLEAWRSSVIMQIIGNSALITVLLISAIIILKQFTRQLQASARLSQLSAIIDSSEDAIIGAALDGRIVSWNAGAEKLFGYTSVEIVNQPFDVLYAETQMDLARSSLNNISQGNGGNHFEATGVRKDRSHVHLAIAMSPVRDSEQRIVGASTIARDITERKQMENIKAAFVSTVSHELRTPITSIRGALGLLESGAISDLPPKALQLIRIAHSNSKRLVGLVNDILDVEKMASGYMKFEIQRVDLSVLAMQAIEANAEYAQSRHTFYVLEEHPKFAWALGDPDRIMQVFANLLSNAAKYSPENEKVIIRIIRIEEKFRVEVEDYGAGIPDMFRPRIFGKFAQAEEQDKKNLGGAGLGLNITKNLVEKMGGDIGFESKVGIRTVFWFTLPACERRHDDFDA